MRYYHTLEEAKNEISRDLKELAVVYQSKSVQDKVVAQDPGYMTLELMNYSYSISSKTLYSDTWFWGTKNLNADYLKEELHERINSSANPGNAYKHDEEYWSQFIHKDTGQFSYSYPERLHGNLEAVVKHIIKNRDSRQLWIPIWWEKDFDNRDNGYRVPCSLGYHFMVRDDKLHMHYIMRSCDFYKHWAKDVILAVAFAEQVRKAYLSSGNSLKLELGTFSHTIFSLHGFAKDMKGVF